MGRKRRRRHALGMRSAARCVASGWPVRLHLPEAVAVAAALHRRGTFFYVFHFAATAIDLSVGKRTGVSACFFGGLPLNPVELSGDKATKARCKPTLRLQTPFTM